MKKFLYIRKNFRFNYCIYLPFLMKLIVKFLFVFMLTLTFTLTSCHDKDDVDEVKTNEHTVIFFFPWSGSTKTKGLYNQILANINDVKAAIADMRGGKNSRYVCFMSDTPTSAVMYEMKMERNTCVCDTFKRFDKPDIYNSEGLAGIFAQAMEHAPAENYGLIVGCHGMGWLPAAVADEVKTRYFGGTTKDFVVDVTEFAAALHNVGKKMDFVLFDDCYMANVEVAYELRNVTDFLIASPNEVIDRGVPYLSVFKYLAGSPDYEAFVNGFYNFYKNYHYPYGTMSAIDCRQVQDMADLMKRINARFVFNTDLLKDIQQFDDMEPTVFYDFGDYVHHLCDDENLLAEFDTELKKLVPFAKATEYVYTVIPNGHVIKIDTFSGLSISDSSLNKMTDSKTDAPWYKATH